MPLAKDLMHPSVTEERRRHKKKRLVQSPNSYFMDVKCTGCYRITTIFSHSQTVVPCSGCSIILTQPQGGNADSLQAAPSDGNSLLLTRRTCASMTGRMGK